MVEAEFFGRDRPRAASGTVTAKKDARFVASRPRSTSTGWGLIPLAERCARVMREALAALEATRGAPSQAVERSRPARISVVFEPLQQD